MSLELRLGVRRFGEGAAALTLAQLQVLVAIAAFERVERRPAPFAAIQRGLRMERSNLEQRLWRLTKLGLTEQRDEPREGFERASIPSRRVWTLTDAGRLVLR